MVTKKTPVDGEAKVRKPRGPRKQKTASDLIEQVKKLSTKEKVTLVMQISILIKDEKDALQKQLDELNHTVGD